MWFIGCLMAVALLAVGGWIGYRVWPRKLLVPWKNCDPVIFFRNDRMGIAVPTEYLVAKVGDYRETASADLYRDLLRTRGGDDAKSIMVCQGTGFAERSHRLFVPLENNLLSAIPYLDSLASRNLIPDYQLYSWTYKDRSPCQEQSLEFQEAFDKSGQILLRNIPDKRLLAPMADFLVFKSATDVRVFNRADPKPPVLTPSQATELAEDVVIVARFYALPLDYFLGIGAVENNYMGVIGDLNHAVWKTHPQRGDVVLRRRKGKVLVRNNARGVWQITRETLRYAQALYLADLQKRDYAALPEALRPEVLLDPDEIKGATLTTFAGLLFRDLLDHFDGNIMQAVGAYNGGPGKPNLQYAALVRNIAHYARKVIIHAANSDKEQTSSVH